MREREKEREQKLRQVVVSGATGFVGQHLVPILLNNNYSVVAIARDGKKAKQFDWFKDVYFITSDFHKNSTKINIENGAGLIHLAWQGLPNYKSLFHFEDNLPFNYSFVKRLVLSGVSQVLITGTCFEYGFQSGPIASTERPQPNNPYALAKDSLRQQLEFLSNEHPFRLQWARLFYMYGKGQNPKSVLSQLDAAIDNGDSGFNMSGGEQLRDYLPIEAVAQQLFDLYVSSRTGTYNICSGNPISVRRLVEERIKDRCASIEPNLGYYPYPDYEPMAFWGVRDISETVLLPALPNAPIKSKTHAQSLAPIRLRLNGALNFIENDAFIPQLIDYSGDYENSQAHSTKFKDHMRSVLSLLQAALPKDSVIVEVGCGKGDFVEMIEQSGYFKVKGYDASYDGNNKSIEKRYLNSSDRIDTDLIVLRHVLEHVPKPYDFLAMLKTIFGQAKIYIEVPNYDWIVANKTFFDITYEHVNYFSQRALKQLFEPSTTQHGLLFDDQYQYMISDLSSLNFEFKRRYDSNDWQFLSFNELFPNIERYIERFEEQARNGAVYVWGAGAKGCLFLAHCEMKNRLIDKVRFAVDQNPKKIGKYLPGSAIEIRSKEDFFRAAKPGDLLLIANPAYKDEIVSQVGDSGLTDIAIQTL
jgi:nucleoside-diphosphate-sugar epimerase